jgi:hypothetical protein
MRPRRGGQLGAAALAGCALCGAVLALASCGGGSDDAGSSAPTTRRPSPAPVDAAPPALGGRSGGALGAPSAPERRAQRRLARYAAAMATTCASVAVPQLEPPAHRRPRWRAQVARLRRSRAWLRSLQDELPGVPIPRGDARLRELANAYRRAVRNEIELDRIVASGLTSHDDRLGVDAGERQNDANRATRRRVATALHVACLARFATG